MVVIDIFKAIKRGKELKNPEIWANIQSLSSIMVTILACTIGVARLLGLDIQITDEQLVTFGGGLAAMLSVGNSVLSVATTKEAGL